MTTRTCTTPKSCRIFGSCLYRCQGPNITHPLPAGELALLEQRQAIEAQRLAQQDLEDEMRWERRMGE